MVRFHRAALEEARLAAFHYAGLGSELGDRFCLTIEKLLAEIEAAPRQFRRFDPPARRHFGSEFPYAIIYVDRPDGVWILVVAHFRQRPGYWKSRLG